MPRYATTAILAAGALLAAAAPASAGTDSPLGHGRFPDVHVSDDGTAHVAWIEQRDGAADGVRYCRVPRGATACAEQAVLYPGDELAGLELVAGAPGTLTLVVEGSAANRRLTFAPPALPADGGWGPAGQDVDIHNGQVAHVAGSIFIAAANGKVQAFDAAGGSVGKAAAKLPASFTAPTFGAVGLDAGVPVAVAADRDHTELFRYTGPLPATVTTLNDGANWSGPAAVAPPLDEPSLAGGPSGLKLFGAAAPGGFPSRPQVVSVPGGERRDVQSDTVGTYFQALAQHAGNGRLYAAWRVNDPAGGHIRFVKSLDGGASWSRAGDLVQAPEELGNALYDINLSSAADQQGLLVYETDRLAGTNAEIRAVTLDLVPKHVPTAKTVNHGIALTGPSVCIPVNGFFKARVKGAGIVAAQLSLDGAQVKGARKAKLHVKGLVPGSSHELRAKVTVKAGGTTVQHKLKRSVAVCG